MFPRGSAKYKGRPLAAGGSRRHTRGMGHVEDYAEPEHGPLPQSLARVAPILLAVVLVAGVLFAVVWFNGGEEAWYVS